MPLAHNLILTTMSRLQDLVSALIVCVLLISGARAVPVGPGSDDDFSTSPEEALGENQDDPSTEPAAHHSDILSMLGALKGGDELKNVESLLKELSIMKAAVNSFLNLSPLFGSILEKAAKTNPALRVVLKASKDQFPDLKDVYDLTVHSRKKEIVSDIVHVELNDQQFLQLAKFLSNATTTMQSATALTRLVKLWTGVNINFNQNVVTAVENGSIAVTKENLAQVNMIHLLEFILGSFTNLNNVVTSIPDQGPTMLQNALKNMSEIDASNLAKIKVLHSQVDNDKYKISDSKGTFLPDPDATRMVDDFASAKKMSKRAVDTSKVISLVTDLLKRFTPLVTRLLHEASTQPTSHQSGQLPVG